MGAVVKIAKPQTGTALTRIEQATPEPMSFGRALKEWAAPAGGSPPLSAEDTEGTTKRPYLTSRLLKGILQASATTRGETLQRSAKIIGVSYNHLMLVIDNKRASSVELRESIAQYCGISADIIRPAPIRSADPAEPGMAKLLVPTNADDPAIVFIPKDATDDDVRTLVAAIAQWANETARQRALANGALVEDSPR